MNMSHTLKLQSKMEKGNIFLRTIKELCNLYFFCFSMFVFFGTIELTDRIIFVRLFTTKRYKVRMSVTMKLLCVLV